jgi:hypothetical protein
MHGSSAEERATARGLFAASFIALFLELMMIRWVPAVVRMVAYYANLMLISSFLGLGVGAMVSDRGWGLFRRFPLLLAWFVVLLSLGHNLALPGSSDEARFFQVDVTALNHALLPLIFLFNALVFVPLGERIGLLFRRLPALRAYAWDLGGSLCGTLAFGLFSFRFFSPVAGMAGVMALYWLVSGRRRDPVVLVPFAVALALMGLGTARGALWSPYYYISVAEHRPGGGAVTRPVAGLRTMTDPPVYAVRVNQDFYQFHGTIDARRYTPGTWLARQVVGLRDQYLLPYALGRTPRRVAVLGAGGGMDVEAALLAGAGRVDAVEIDPVLVALSRRYNAAGVYDDPRVTVILDDARAFVRRARPGYDLIAFGFLDSQALFSSMSNLRLDGYIYTVESMRASYRLLAPDGVLTLSFACPHDWLAAKLRGMLQEATGRTPIVYGRAGQLVLCVARGETPAAPERFGSFRRVEIPRRVVPLPTDDWPYLYLSRRAIPRDYLATIAGLLALSALVVLTPRRGGIGPSEGQFLFLGVGFLLLQTLSIGDCSLYFGATWFVTMVIVAGVLLMVLLANLAAMRLERPATASYVPLFVALLALYLVPRELILSWPFAGRLAWALLAVPLPVFFAGLVFSTSFRAARDVPAALGANLVGAMIGGFCEYLGMATGLRVLYLLVMAAYAASLACRVVAASRARRTRRDPVASASEAPQGESR